MILCVSEREVILFKNDSFQNDKKDQFFCLFLISNNFFCYGRADQDTYRLVHLEKLSDMWNQSFRQHQNEKPNCEGFLYWDTRKEEQRGFVWRATLSCDQCSFISNKYKLYTEIPCKKKGPKAAAINYGIQVGLTQVPMGAAGLRKILLSGNIPAPSTKGMQNSANKVCEKIKLENLSDMAKIREELKTINTYRGHPQNEIDVEGDACYNNPLYSGVGKTPFQPATQSCYVIVENMTDKKLVINLVTKNKLCSHGKDHSNENINEKNCKCTQNLQMVESIGNEEASAKEGLKTLYSEGFEIRHITTDPDSSAYRAAELLSYEYNTKTMPVHLLDTRHFSDNQRKFIKKNETLANLMPARTKKKRDYLFNKFALDLTQRCNAEYQSALKSCNGDLAKFKRKLSHTVDAIILCYQNKHCICKKNSFVCEGKENPWIKKSTFLSQNFKLNLTIKEQAELRKCINYRLGPKELEKTKLGTNTQKVECVNRIIRRSLPRSLNFRKNFQGRANSAVSSANHGPGESVMALCLSVGAPVVRGTKVHRHLQQEQKIYENNKLYKKTPKCKQNRKQKAKNKFDLYSENCEDLNYNSGMLLNSKTCVNKKRSDTARSDHDSYTKKARR